MPDIELIAVSKGREYLQIHPAALANHRELGWSECALREVPTTDDLLATRDHLVRRSDELDERAERLAERERANLAEAERLAALAAAPESASHGTDAGTSDPRASRASRGAKAAADTSKPALQEPSSEAAAEQPKE